MITPIRAMTISEICNRKDDLLMSADDIKELARNERAKTIQEFAEQFCATCCENTFHATINGIKNVEMMTLDGVTETIFEVAEKMKGGD